MCPAFSWDLGTTELTTYTYSELEKLSLEDLAAAIRSEILLVTPMGSRQYPRLSDLTPYLLLASEHTFTSRHPVWQRLFPLSSGAVNVQHTGELAAKVSFLCGSSRGRMQVQEASAGIAHLIRDGQPLMQRLFTAADARDAQRGRVMMTNGARITVPLTDLRPPTTGGSALIRIELTPCDGEYENWTVEVHRPGADALMTPARPRLEIIPTTAESLQALRIDIVYHGPRRTIPLERSMSATAKIVAGRLVHPARSRTPSGLAVVGDHDGGA